MIEYCDKYRISWGWIWPMSLRVFCAIAYVNWWRILFTFSTMNFTSLTLETWCIIFFVSFQVWEEVIRGSCMTTKEQWRIFVFSSEDFLTLLIMMNHRYLVGVGLRITTIKAIAIESNLCELEMWNMTELLHLEDNFRLLLKSISSDKSIEG